MTPDPYPSRPKVGIALGSGSARGWAHIGVLKALQRLGIEPCVVSGTSVGAIVGAMYAAGRLEGFEDWVRQLTRRGILGYLDPALGSGGGFIEGKRLAATFKETFGDVDFGDLKLPFGAVATDLYTGQERWLRQGSVVEALRASVALPGLFTPAHIDGEWLVDGGLVNPVPATLCYAMGAEVVIAVNLNGDIVGRHFHRYPTQQEDDPKDPDESAADREAEGIAAWLAKLQTGVREVPAF